MASYIGTRDPTDRATEDRIHVHPVANDMTLIKWSVSQTEEIFVREMDRQNGSHALFWNVTWIWTQACDWFVCKITLHLHKGILFRATEVVMTTVISDDVYIYRSGL
jgi:hypothetical protein